MLLSMFFTGVVFAGISIDPSRVELVMTQGETFSGKYTIISNNEGPVELTITYDTWKNSQENGEVLVSSWLTVPAQKIVLQPNKPAEVAYKVKSGNLTGSVSAMVSFTYRSPTVSNMSMMTSLPVYLTIEGTQSVDFGIKSFAARRGSGNTPSNQVAFILQNDGNVPVRPNGKVEVLKGKKSVLELSLLGLDPVYAGSERAYYKVLGNLEKGKYTLKISLSGNDKTVEKSLQFKVNKYGEIINQ